MKIDFWQDRNIVNKLLFIIYRTQRTFFVGFYFYFYPALSLILTFALPMAFRI